MDWKDYQNKIADLFRDLGCEVENEILIHGARGSHRVDVLVTFTKFGIVQKWVIESKYWKSAVTKEKVMNLQGIINDIGADRGILVSQSGFQSGAIQAAKNTNILLTSFDDLERRVIDELLEGLLISIEKRVDEISSEIARLTYITEITGKDSSYSYPNPKYDTELTGNIFARLASLSFGIKNARFGEFPAITGFENDHRTPRLAYSLEEFVTEASRIVNEAHALWASEKERVG